MPDPTQDPTNQGGGFSGALNSILSNPLVTTLLPVALGVVGGLGQPGTKWGGGTGKALEGAAAGLQQGQETRALQAQAQREQQELALKTQQLNQQKALNDITLSNEQIKQKYLQSLPPDKQAQFLADPKAYMDMDLMTKAAPASIAALKATGKFSPDALQAFSTLDPVTLHDVTTKALDAFTAGKETDLQKLHDSYKASGMNDTAAWKQAAMDLKAAPQIAVTEARGDTQLADINARGAQARATKQTAPGESADTAAERSARAAVDTERAAGTLPASASTAARTVQIVGPDGKPHVFGFNPTTGKYDKDQGVAPPKSVSGRVEAGADGLYHVINPTTGEDTATSVKVPAKGVTTAIEKGGDGVYHVIDKNTGQDKATTVKVPSTPSTVKIEAGADGYFHRLNLATGDDTKLNLKVPPKGGHIEVGADGKYYLINPDGNSVETGLAAGTASGAELSRMINPEAANAPALSRPATDAPTASRTASPSATPGPAARTSTAPPAVVDTPKGTGKYDPAKSKTAGRPVYVAPDGSVWGG